eukprot:GILK01005215.1.p1 GENE.GILK01005215.1~~GILK01005215.1.p1  ORF type:complete len:523 (+),score=119.06 GILK01005215.1:43-1569(+)
MGKRKVVSDEDEGDEDFTLDLTDDEKRVVTIEARSSSRLKITKSPTSAKKQKVVSDEEDDEDFLLDLTDVPEASRKAPKMTKSSIPSKTSKGLLKTTVKRKAPQGNPSIAHKLSTDVNVVLAKVNELRTQMQLRSTKKRVTLQDLNLPNINKEVRELEDGEVVQSLEQLVFSIARTILAGNGFSFSIPTRTASNQLYVAELDRIVLKDKVLQRIFANSSTVRKAALTTRVCELVRELCLKQIHVTKRDMFYTDVKLFQKQADSDDVLEDVACLVGCTRTSLNVVASEKGVVVGRISFRDDGDLIDCTKMGVGGKAIPPNTDRVTDIRGDAQFVLLVEKDAAFMRLAEDRFYNTYPCIIITAKGQPDVATRIFLKRVKETLQIPILGLVDSDPYGLKILSVYMSGSKNMSYDSASLTTSDIKWLGVRPSDLNKYGIPDQCRLKLTEHDIKTGKELLQEDFIKKNPVFVEELELMLQTGEKAEIQALSSFGFQYLSQVYLPLKLQEGDWV